MKIIHPGAKWLNLSLKEQKTKMRLKTNSDGTDGCEGNISSTDYIESTLIRTFHISSLSAIRYNITNSSLT